MINNDIKAILEPEATIVADTQQYINELEERIEMIKKAKDRSIQRLDEYQGDGGINLVLRDIVLNVMSEEGGSDLQDDIDGFEDRISELEYANENAPDEYETTDNVVESMTFETKVREIVAMALQDISISTKIDTTNLE